MTTFIFTTGSICLAGNINEISESRKIFYFTVWKIQNFTLAISNICQKFRQINVFIEELNRKLISRKISQSESQIKNLTRFFVKPIYDLILQRRCWFDRIFDRNRVSWEQNSVISTLCAKSFVLMFQMLVLHKILCWHLENFYVE